MIKSVDIIFWVEHKDRELDSYRTLARKLKCDYGITSIIISNFFHGHYLWFYKAKIYIFNNISINTGWPNGFLWSAFRDKIIYISHRWEQLLFPIGERIHNPRTNFAKNIVKYVVWSDYFKDYLNSNGVKSSNIDIVRNISHEILYDFVKNHSKEYKLKLSKEFNLPLDKKILFFPMNYLWAFFSDDAIEHRISKGVSPEIAKKFRKYSKDSLSEFIKFCLSLSLDKNFLLIIRPHPSITIDDYIKKFSEKTSIIPDNIIFNKSHSIREWIAASDIIGSSMSTSVWEAHNLGKKSFYFTPFPRPKWLDTFWMREVPNINKIKEFYDILKLNMNTDTKLANKPNNINEFCELLSNHLKNMGEIKIKKIELKYIKYFIKFMIKNFLCKYLNFIFIRKWQRYDWFDVVKNGE